MEIPSLRASAASASAMASGNSLRNLTLNLGGERYDVGASNDVIDRLEDHVRRQALRKGGRR